MRLTHCSLIAGMICLGFTVGCDHSMPSEGRSEQNDVPTGQPTAEEGRVPATKQGVSAGQAAAESHIQIMKPGVINKQDEGKTHAKGAKKKINRGTNAPDPNLPGN